MQCNCPKTNCIRHGDCEACKQYHETGKRVPYCLRKSGKKQKCLIVPAIIVVALGIIGIAVGLSIQGIIDNKYSYVQQMQIADVPIDRLPDGDYSGEFSYGKNIYDVTVTIRSHRIADIVLRTNLKAPHLPYVEKAKSIIREIIRTQSLQIDAVSGATRSSKSILKAVENALSRKTAMY